MQNQICLSDSGSDEEVPVGVVPKCHRKEPMWNSDDMPCCEENEIQIKNDKEIALALQNELDKEETVFTEEYQVISALEKKVISDFRDSVFIVVRRKAQLGRKLKLWQRATNKVFPEHILRVKFLGEDGIDTGALAKEFLTKTLAKGEEIDFTSPNLIEQLTSKEKELLNEIKRVSKRVKLIWACRHDT